MYSKKYVTGGDSPYYIESTEFNAPGLAGRLIWRSDTKLNLTHISNKRDVVRSMQHAAILINGLVHDLRFIPHARQVFYLGTGKNGTAFKVENADGSVVVLKVAYDTADNNDAIIFARLQNRSKYAIACYGVMRLTEYNRAQVWTHSSGAPTVARDNAAIVAYLTEYVQGEEISDWDPVHGTVVRFDCVNHPDVWEEFKNAIYDCISLGLAPGDLHAGNFLVITKPDGTHSIKFVDVGNFGIIPDKYDISRAAAISFLDNTLGWLVEYFRPTGHYPTKEINDELKTDRYSLNERSGCRVQNLDDIYSGRYNHPQARYIDYPPTRYYRQVIADKGNPKLMSTVMPKDIKVDRAYWPKLPNPPIRKGVWDKLSQSDKDKFSNQNYRDYGTNSMYSGLNTLFTGGNGSILETMLQWILTHKLMVFCALITLIAVIVIIVVIVNKQKNN